MYAVGLLIKHSGNSKEMPSVPVSSDSGAKLLLSGIS